MHKGADKSNKNLAYFAGVLARRWGKKFLQLNEGLDEVFPATEADRNACMSLYIHIPFCRTLCPFCCFSRYLFKEDKARRYFETLRKELDFYVQQEIKFSNFYFGGGTPTVLMDELVRFIDFLKDNFDVKLISIETTPSNINHQNIDSLKAAGINRLSIGVQSFDNEVLKSMGRSTVTGEEVKKKLAMAQGHFDTVNADFIFNFPGQTISKFADDVNTFKSVGIDQATFYPLMPSPLKTTAIERSFKRIDTSREEDFYDVILKELYDTGYKASTAWCFSQDDKMIDEYIVNFDDYIGVGAGSLSFVKGIFYVNTFSLERYGALASSGKLPIVLWRNLSEREHLYYYTLTKLFGMKMNSYDFSQRFGGDPHSKLKRELSLLKLFGLIDDLDDVIVTRKGMYVVSVMMREFFAAINSLREYCVANRI